MTSSCEDFSEPRRSSGYRCFFNLYKSRGCPHLVRCLYNAANFLPNPHKIHPIARDRYGMYSVRPNCDLYSASVTAVMSPISCYIRLRALDRHSTVSQSISSFVCYKLLHLLLFAMQDSLLKFTRKWNTSTWTRFNWWFVHINGTENNIFVCNTVE